MSGKDELYKKYIKSRTLGGALFGGTIGYTQGSGIGAVHGSTKKSKKEQDKIRKRWSIGGALAGAALGGLAGNKYGKLRVEAHKEHAKAQDAFQRAYQERMYRASGGTGDWNYHHYAKKPSAGIDQHLKFLGIKKDVATKKEVTNHFRDLAKKHHPDKGGSEQYMRDINNAYDNIKKSEWFDKLAFINGFRGVLGL